MSRNGLLRRALGALLGGATNHLVRLGKRLGYPAFATIPVSAVMLSRVPFVSPQQPLEEVAQMFVAGRTAQVPVVEDGAPVGVVTREDVVAGLERSGPHAPISAAPRHDVVTVTPYDSLADVLERLRHSPRAVAVVVDRGAPVGLVTADLLRSYLDQKLA